MSPPSQHRSALATLASHSIGNLAYRVAALALAAVYAMRLGPEAFGRLEQLLAASMLLVPLVSWQVQEAFLAVQPKHPKTAICAAGMLLSAACLLVVLAAWIIAASGVADARIVVLMTLHSVTTIAWQLARNVVRNRRLLRVLLTAEMCQSLVMLGSGLLILEAGAGYEGAVWAIAIGNVVSCTIATLAAAVQPGGCRRYTWPTAAVQDIVVVAARLLPNVLLWWVIELSDRLLLAWYLGDREVGVYSAGARLAGVGMAASLLVYQAWQVAAIRALDEGRSSTYFRKTLPWFGTAVSLLFSALLCVVGPVVPLLFGDGFAESAGLAAALVPAFYLAAFCYFFGIVLYVPGGPVSPWRASLVGVVISVTLNLLLIPCLALYAAALASMFAYLAMLVIRVREAVVLVNAGLTFRNFYAPFFVIVVQAATVVAELDPLVTCSGFVLLLLLRRDEIMPFMRSGLMMLRSGR